MRIQILLCLIISLIISGCSTMLKPKEEPVALDITIEELELKMQKARDPNKLFQKATSYVQRQVLTSGSEQMLVFASYLAPDKYKIETYKDNLPYSSIILNGNSAWMVDHNKREAKSLQPVDVDRLKTMMKLGDPNDSYQSLFRHVELTQCKIDGKEYYKMSCIPKHKSGSKLDIYVGKNSYLIREIKITGELNYSSKIEKYSLFEGVIIPERTVIEQEGKESTSVINLNKLNVPLETSNFLPPLFPPK